MGMTWKRVTFGMLVLAAALLPLRKSAEGGEVDSAPDRNARLDSLVVRERAARTLASMLAARDSAIALLESAGVSGQEPEVVPRGFPPGERPAGVDSFVASLWRRLGTADTSVTTSVMVYNAGRTSWMDYAGTLLLAKDGHTSCVAIIPASRWTNGKIMAQKATVDESLGPCTLLMAFGRPGASVAAWLSQSRYQSARSNDWLLMPKDFTNREGPWDRVYNDTPRRIHAPFLVKAMYATGFEDAFERRAPYEWGAAGIRCLVGDAASCAEGVLHPAITIPDAPAVPADVTNPSFMPSTRPITLATVRPASRALVSGMLAEFGREKFATFWKSDQPFETAFRNAFGVPLSDWTARWARREWESTWEAKYHGSTINLGVTLHPTGPLIVIWWSSAAVLVAAWVAKRRRG
jgi:hypothetical protein